MADIPISTIVSLAQACYEQCRAVTDYKEQAARIAERCSWIITRIERWRHICDSDEQKDTALRLQEALKGVNHCMEAAKSKNRKSWRSRVKLFIGGKDLLKAIEQAEYSLNVVLHDLNLDRTAEIMSKLSDGFKSMEEMFEAFGSAQSSNDPSKTNQEEHDDALQAILDETSEIIIAKQSSSKVGKQGDTSRVQFAPTKKELEALEINLDEVEYKEEDLIGGGGFADVYAGFYNRTPVAIKCLKIDKRELEIMSKSKIRRDAKRIAAEALLGYRCSIHPSIVQILGFHVDLKGERMMERPIIVMERMHITLFEVLHYKRKEVTLSYSQRYQFLLDIARAIEFIHLQGIVHRDVKSLNILLNKDLTEAKLADFGEAKVKGLDSTKMQLSTILSTSAGSNNVAGTVAYQAPELLTGKVKETSRVSEMYSFGVTVWECLSNKIPHKGKRTEEITVKAITKKRIPMLKVPTEPALISQEMNENSVEMGAWIKLQKAALACLSRDRTSRPTASKLVREWNQTRSPTLSVSVSSRRPSLGLVKKEIPTGNTQITASTLSTGGHTNGSSSSTEREDPELGLQEQGVSSSHTKNHAAESPTSQPDSSEEENMQMHDSKCGIRAVLIAAFAICLVVIGVVVAVTMSSSPEPTPTAQNAASAPVTSPTFSPATNPPVASPTISTVTDAPVTSPTNPPVNDVFLTFAPVAAPPWAP